MRVAGWVLLGFLALGCDGLGRPIVGSQPLEHDDMERCGVLFACEPIETLAAEHFEVPATPTPRRIADCDDDSIEDSLDNCVGVWNPTQNSDECAPARAACDALQSGSLSHLGADLRGCRVTAPIEMGQGASFEGANLRCADLTFSADADARIELRGAVVSFTRLDVSGPIVLDATDTTVSDSTVRLADGARLYADRSIWQLAGVWVERGPAVATERSHATIDLRASSLDSVTLVEAPSSRPGRVRIDESTMQLGLVSVPVLDIVSSTVRLSTISASELDLLNTELSRSEVRSAQAIIAASELLQVVFDRCEDIAVVASELLDVDIPACEPEAFYVRDSKIEGARLGGGILLDSSELLASTVGGGPGSVLRTTESDLDGVQFCDLEAAAFAGGELRCVTCDEAAFNHGSTVCLAGSRLVERGCQAIELAPSCD